MSCELRKDGVLHGATAEPAPSVADNVWRTGLPVLGGSRVTLRELRPSDAPGLVTMLSNEEVTRFISPPPSTVDGFEQFIEWTQRKRAAGSYLCFGVVPHGFDTAVGVFQIWQMDPAFGAAEWGFAIGSPFWGTGVFVESARLVLDFAFETIGVHRLEGRATVQNARGNGALRKIGAMQEGVLRQWFHRDQRLSDGILWSIVRDDRIAASRLWTPPIH